MKVKNLRRTRNTLVFVVFPAGGVLLILLSSQVNELLGYLLLPFLFGVIFLAARMRCPKCQELIGRYTFKFLGREDELVTLVAPRECRRCGYDLTGRSKPVPPTRRKPGC